MKKGIKLKRIAVNSQSCRVFIGKIYTFDGEKDGFIRLKERFNDGYSWLLKNFEIERDNK